MPCCLSGCGRAQVPWACLGAVAGDGRRGRTCLAGGLGTAGALGLLVQGCAGCSCLGLVLCCVLQLCASPGPSRLCFFCSFIFLDKIDFLVLTRLLAVAERSSSWTEPLSSTVALCAPTCVLIPWGGSAICPQGQTPPWTLSLVSCGGAGRARGPASTTALLRTSSVAPAVLLGHTQLLLVP